MVLQNERTYLQYVDDDEKRMRERSIITMHSISSTVRADYPRMIHLDTVMYNDDIFGVSFGLEHNEIFKNNPASVRFLPFQGK